VTSFYVLDLNGRGMGEFEKNEEFWRRGRVEFEKNEEFWRGERREKEEGPNPSRVKQRLRVMAGGRREGN
jgi:hypothetical protein